MRVVSLGIASNTKRIPVINTVAIANLSTADKFIIVYLLHKTNNSMSVLNALPRFLDTVTINPVK